MNEEYIDDINRQWSDYIYNREAELRKTYNELIETLKKEFNKSDIEKLNDIDFNIIEKYVRSRKLGNISKNVQ